MAYRFFCTLIAVAAASYSELVATFANDLVKGSITFTPDGLTGNVLVTGSLVYVDSTAAATSNHAFHVHAESLVDLANCTTAGAHFDPEDKEGPNYTCDPEKPADCYKGDLSGKHGTITVGATVAMADAQLTMEELRDRSVVLHASGAGPRIACAALQAPPPAAGAPPSTYPCMTAKLHAAMRKTVTDHIDSLDSYAGDAPKPSRGDFVGGVVRLSFHDAGTWDRKERNGGPDGCVDLTDPDNGGLEQVIALLEPLYAPYQNRSSRADFWALAANAAIEHQAMRIRSQTKEKVPLAIPFHYGRLDRASCSGDEGRLPAATTGWGPIQALFGDRMGFTNKEIVALMGAHTLGRCEASNSGFEGPWKAMTRAESFDSGYYISAVTTNWDKLPNAKGNVQWQFTQETSGEFAQMLLTTDVALLLANAGDDDCNATKSMRGGGLMEADSRPANAKCTINNLTIDYFRQFTAEKLFFPAFEQAFSKLQELGWENKLLAPGTCFAGSPVVAGEEAALPPGGTVEAREGLGEAEMMMDLGIVLMVLIVVGAWMMQQFVHNMGLDFIPEGFFAILLGFVAGLVDHLSGGQVKSLVTFNTHTFQLFLLPPIIFNAGFSLRKKDFLRNIGTISLYAVAGTLISTCIFGVATYTYTYTFTAGADTLHLGVEAFMFGSLISAIDPVASLAVFARVFGVVPHSTEPNPLLYNLVFGESVLNDAVSIVLYKGFKLYVGLQFQGADVFLIGLKVAGVALGSVALGLLFGWTTALLFKHSSLKENSTYEIFIVFFCSYGCFILCEAINLSGITAIFVCGICQAHYTWYNITPEGRAVLPRVFTALAVVGETLVFAFLGMAFFAFYDAHDWNAGFIIMMIVMCFVSRACSVFPLTLCANKCRAVKITLKQTVVLWFSGLRGAIAFALVIDMTSISWPGWEGKAVDGMAGGSPNSHMFTSTVLVVVIFTTLVCGTTTPLLLRTLGVGKEERHAQRKNRTVAKAQNFDKRVIQSFFCTKKSLLDEHVIGNIKKEFDNEEQVEVSKIEEKEAEEEGEEEKEECKTPISVEPEKADQASKEAMLVTNIKKEDIQVAVPDGGEAADSDSD